MDCSSEEDSCSTSRSDSYPEENAWQPEVDQMFPDDAHFEEYIKTVVDDWLTQHGKALFSLESSKFLMKESKKATCSLNSPFKPPRRYPKAESNTRIDITK